MAVTEANISTTQLRAVVAVAQCGRFVSAAAALGLSQSSLSRIGQSTEQAQQSPVLRYWAHRANRHRFPRAASFCWRLAVFVRCRSELRNDIHSTSLQPSRSTRAAARELSAEK
jgi:Bacterial regulatory helix-turn-helix protein, lysR family